MKALKRISFLILVLLLIVFVFGSLMAVASDYPNKPIRCIVTYGAGGGTDMGVRILAQFAEKYIGVPIIVTNVTGGGGTIGWTAIALSDPDGYTIGNFNNAAILSSILTETEYDPIDDFEHIVLQVSDARTFCTSAKDDRFLNFEQFLDYGLKNPGKITITSQGPGSTGYMAIQAFEYFGKVDVEPIVFTGSAEEIAAVLGGHVTAGSWGIGEITRLVEDGELRLLIVATDERVEEWPDVPTFKEYGIDFSFAANRGICAPAGTPKEIIDYLAEAFQKTMNDPGYIEEMKKAGLKRKPLPPDDYKKMVKEEYKFFELMTNQ